jgi:hypothetical protein
MEYFCEKTVEVFDDHMIIHQAGEVERMEKKDKLDDLFRRFGTDEMKREWFKDTKVS